MQEHGILGLALKFLSSGGGTGEPCALFWCSCWILGGKSSGRVQVKSKTHRSILTVFSSSDWLLPDLWGLWNWCDYYTSAVLRFFFVKVNSSNKIFLTGKQIRAVSGSLEFSEDHQINKKKVKLNGDQFRDEDSGLVHCQACSDSSCFPNWLTM